MPKLEATLASSEDKGLELIRYSIPELSSDLTTSDFLNVNPMKLLSFDVNICIIK